jgi:hypothetical protein
MNEIIDSVKGINILDFFVGNLLWEVVAIVLFGFVFKGLYNFFKFNKKANEISYKLLSNNRPAMNGKSPLYLADRFIQIWNWNTKRNQPLRYDNKHPYTPIVFSKCYFHEVAIHKELKELGLIVVNDDPLKTISPVKNKLNTFVYKKCTKYLIKYQFDTEETHKSLSL